MTNAKVLTSVGAVVMGSALAYGFAVGDFWGDGRVIVGVAWGRVSLVDVYVGFLLFCGWVAYRERSLAVASVWIVLILVLGNMMTSGYAFLALVRSHGNWARFWMGARADERVARGHGPDGSRLSP